MGTIAKAERRTLDLNVTQAAVYFDVANYVTFTLHTMILSGTFGTAVLTVNRSNDGFRWFALETATTLGPGASMSNAIESLGFARVRVQVTTVEGAAGVVEVALTAKGDS